MSGPAFGSRGAVGRDAVEVGAERALEAPEVAHHLHPQPELGTVATELAETERHLRGDRLLAPKEPVHGHPADAELTRRLSHRQLQPVGEDLAQQLARMGRAARAGRSWLARLRGPARDRRAVLQEFDDSCLLTYVNN
jgi:hypothetical protein